MKRVDIDKLANYFGYEVRELLGDWRYSDRRGKVYEIWDRREYKGVAVYSTLRQVADFLKRVTPGK